MYNLTSGSHSSQFPSGVLQRIRAGLRPLAVPSLAVVALILAASSGVVAFKLPPKFVELALAGIAFFLLALCGSEFVILSSLALGSTLFDLKSLPYLFGISSPELIVFFLLGLVLVNRLSSREGSVRTPLDRPILLFVGAAIVSFLNARYNLETVWSFRNAVMRTVLVYLLFFAVTNLVKTRRQLMTLVGGMFVMATIVAGFMVAQQVVGSTVSILPGQERVYNATALGQELVDVARLPSSGAVMICVMLFPAFLLQIVPEYVRGRKWLSCIPLALFPPAIAFTFDRNLWIGVAIASIASILIVRAESGRVYLLVLALVIGAVVLGSLLGAYFPRIGTMFDALSVRFLSLFAGEELVYDSSTQWRLMENEYAIATIQKYPLLGIGPRAAYRPPIRLPEDLQCHYVHNAYLWLLVDFGIVGFLPFLWFSTAFLLRGISAWYTLDDPILRSLALGFTVGYVVLLVSSLAAPRFLTTNGAVLVGAVLGINEVIIRLGQQARQ